MREEPYLRWFQATDGNQIKGRTKMTTFFNKNDGFLWDGSRCVPFVSSLLSPIFYSVLQRVILLILQPFHRAARKGKKKGLNRTGSTRKG